MTGRGARGRANPDMGLDSFMDIVTNVIGALFFILVYATLSSLGARGKVTLPMAREAETEAVFFECRGNTVLFPDIDGLRKQAEGKADEWRRGTISNDYYVCRGLNAFEIVPDSRGETGALLAHEDSEFRAQLSLLDTNKQHLLFIVRTDSFEVFHAARRIAVDSGFRMGWEPYAEQRPLTFGAGGRSTDDVDL